MAWLNGPVTLYHGTDAASAATIATAAGGFAHGVSLRLCRPLCDFGQGFYTTTSLHQAQQWANQRVRRLRPPGAATVIGFSVSRAALEALADLVFAVDSGDFYDLVAFARAGGRDHARPGGPYDVVYGPVALGRQRLSVKDCDQISFHTRGALRILPSVSSRVAGTPLF